MINEQVLKYIKTGLYNNVLFYPSTRLEFKKYLKELNPLIDLIKNENREEILEVLNNKIGNIYTISLTIASIGLDKESYKIIKKNIESEKDLYIFIGIYTVITRGKRGRYIDQLYLDKLYLLGEYTQVIQSISKPSFKVSNAIHRKYRGIKKVKSMLEERKNLDNVLELIKKYEISPDNISIQLGFNLPEIVKNNIVSYFISKYPIESILIHLDNWYLYDINETLIKEIASSISNKKKLKDKFNLLIISTGLKNTRISRIIRMLYEYEMTDRSEEKIKIVYVPTIKQTHKFDKEYTYSTISAAIVALLSEQFNSNCYINKDLISSRELLYVFDSIKDSTSFSLYKDITPEQENGISILISNKIIPKFEIIWDNITIECPDYNIDRDYILISGKNSYLLDSIKHIIKR